MAALTLLHHEAIALGALTHAKRHVLLRFRRLCAPLRQVCDQFLRSQLRLRLRLRCAAPSLETLL